MMLKLGAGNGRGSSSPLPFHQSTVALRRRRMIRLSLIVAFLHVVGIFQIIMIHSPPAVPTVEVDYPQVQSNQHAVIRSNDKDRIAESVAIMNNIFLTARVAYVISITHCNWELIEATAIHGHSIDIAHYQYSSHTVTINATTSATIVGTHSRHAIVHPDAMLCLPILRDVLKYDTQLEDVPLALDTIRSPALRELIDADNSGCCGAKELLKLYAYTLEEHDVVVHLDTDVLVLRPPWDVIADMLIDKRDSNGDRGMWSQTEPPMFNRSKATSATTRPDFFFTRDYLQSSYHNDPDKFAVQGGMFILRPSRAVFQKLIRTIQRSAYAKRSGWDQDGFGGFWGAPQIQGLLSYFYYHPQQQGTAVELDRCYYNNMGAEPPRWHNVSRRAKYDGQCTSARPTCQDCRKVSLSDIIFAHYTMCSKPWKCLRQVKPDPNNLCFVLHQAWFAVRESLERQEPFEATRIRWPTLLQSRQEDRPFWSNATLSYCTNPNNNITDVRPKRSDPRPKRGTYHPLTFINISSVVEIDLIERLTPTKTRKPKPDKASHVATSPKIQV